MQRSRYERLFAVADSFWARMLSVVEQSTVECCLVEGAEKITRVRQELADLDNSLVQLLSQVEDLRIRSIASEIPAAIDRVVEAERRVDVLVAARASLSASMQELRQTQDCLLDQLPKIQRQK